MSAQDTIHDTILTADGHKYTGELRTIEGIAGLVLDGTGEMFYTNGDRYTGEWRRNKRNIHGTLFYADGTIYDGEWNDDQRHGCGHLHSPDGYEYAGTFQKDYRQGMGVETLPDSERFTGHFVQNKREGRGLLEQPDGSSYEGMFADNAMNGKGALRYSNGDYVEGTFKNNVVHGNAKFFFSNGDMYEGEYRQGIRVGGTLTKADGVAFNATFDSQGDVSKLTRHDGSIVQFTDHEVATPDAASGEWNRGNGQIQGQEGQRYDGAVSEGLPHGYGLMVYGDAGKYEGHWTRGNRDGNGKMVWTKNQKFGPTSTGWRYEGAWAADVFHGYGQLWYDTEGANYCGLWRNGQKHGLGKEVKGHEVYEGSFAEDRRSGRGTLNTGKQIITGNFSDGECNDDEAQVSYGGEGTTYSGAVRCSVRHGEGRMMFPNGDSYEGEFFSDRKHGVGLYTFAEGATYEGQFRDDQMNGAGVLRKQNWTYDGTFKNGMRHGRGKLRYSDNGKLFNVVFDKDILVSQEEAMGVA